MSKLKTKMTGAEKKYQGAVLKEVIGDKEDSGNVVVKCQYREDRIKESKGKGINGAGILDIDSR